MVRLRMLGGVDVRDSAGHEPKRLLAQPKRLARRALFSPAEGFTRTNLELARALLALGRPQEAVSILQPALRGSIDGANFYGTRTELHETLAQAFEIANVRDSAAFHFAAVAAAWADADPPLRQRAAAAQLRIAQPPDRR